MADEKRIATEEWLDGNLNEFKKGTPSATKKCVTKEFLINNYNVTEDLLNEYVNNRLIPRVKIQGQNSDFDFPIGILNTNTIDEVVGGGYIVGGGDANNIQNIKTYPTQYPQYDKIIKLNSDFSVNTNFTDNLSDVEVMKIFTFHNGNIALMCKMENGSHILKIINSLGVVLNNDLIPSYREFINCTISKDRQTICGIVRDQFLNCKIVLLTSDGNLTILSSIMLGKPNDAYFFSESGFILISGGESFVSFNGTDLNSVRTVLISSGGQTIKQFTEDELIPWERSPTEQNNVYRSRISTIIYGTEEVIRMEYYINRIDTDLNRNYKMAVFLKSDGTKLRDTTSFFVMATDLENDITKITPKISENSDRFFYQEAVEGNELFYVDNVTFNSNRIHFTPYTIDTSPNKPHTNGVATPTSDAILNNDYLIKVNRVSSVNEIYEIGGTKYLGIVSKHFPTDL